MTSLNLRLGDCLNAMREMKAHSVDAIVTDPPYGLEFMGKEWDKLGDDPDVGAPSTGFSEMSGRADNRKGNEGGTWFGSRSASSPNYYRTGNAKCRNCGKWRISGGHDGKGNTLGCKCENPDFPNLKAIAARKMQDWHQHWAIEALRIAKPGAHLLAFGGTRTHHRLMCAIEDAGWEIRDTIFWLYGSGFPKSLDVGKAIDRQDKERKPEREVVGRWLRKQRELAGLNQKQVAAHWPSATGGLTGCVANWELGFNCPTWDQWLRLKEIIGFDDEIDAEVWRLNGRKGQPGENWAKRVVVGTGKRQGGPPQPMWGDEDGREWDVTISATDAAKQWDGWGTALKPAVEPIVLARKPLIGTVAENVLEHGTGGLNIDGCRVETDGATARPPLSTNKHEGWQRPWNDDPQARQECERRREAAHDKRDNVGRWPANVVLDEEAGKLLDSQSGNRGGKWGKQGKIGRRGMASAPTLPNAGEAYIGDVGGASRFFYCAKSSRAEREAGLSGPKRVVKIGAERHKINPTTGREVVDPPWSNNHPTVKPIALMRWLCRLITPPGGLILDPFMGSGTTGIAAALEGFRFVGIEQESEYLEIAEARIDHAREQTSLFQLETETP